MKQSLKKIPIVELEGIIGTKWLGILATEASENLNKLLRVTLLLGKLEPEITFPNSLFIVLSITPWTHSGLYPHERKTKGLWVSVEHMIEFSPCNP